MRIVLALTASLVLLTAVGCDYETRGSGDPTEVEYASELGVELAAMTLRPSGLYLQDRLVGAGTTATPGKLVSVHYTGWFPDGRSFDSSRDGTPFEFTLGMRQVIKGWDEGVNGMQVGGKRLLVIPSTLGYGEQGSRTGTIPPNSVLVFEVELLGVR